MVEIYSSYRSPEEFYLCSVGALLNLIQFNSIQFNLINIYLSSVYNFIQSSLISEILNVDPPLFLGHLISDSIQSVPMA